MIKHVKNLFDEIDKEKTPKFNEVYNKSEMLHLINEIIFNFENKIGLERASINIVINEK